VSDKVHWRDVKMIRKLMFARIAAPGFSSSSAPVDTLVYADCSRNQMQATKRRGRATTITSDSP
jgi:hypothetical protein